MHKGRVEAFSDGVIAIILTIMVLELRPPEGADWGDLGPVLPKLLSYLLSFVFVGVYWNNHHHLFQVVKQVGGWVLWSNALLLFCLSLIPFSTAWMGEHHAAPVPVALYGINLLMCAIAFTLLVFALLRVNGPETGLREALGKDWKGKVSLLLNFVAVGLAFVNEWLAIALYVTQAVIWFVPDTRMEKALLKREKNN